MQSWWKNNFFSWKNTDAVVLKEEFWENHKNNNNTLTFLFPIGTQSGFGQAHSPITSWVHFVAQLISGIGGRGPKSAPIDDGIAIRGLVSVVVLPVLSACILPISVVANISVVVVSSVSVVLPVLPIIKSIISLSRNQGC